MNLADEPLATSDPKVMELVRAEERRQADQIRLIPSGKHVSRTVPEAKESVFTDIFPAPGIVVKG